MTTYLVQNIETFATITTFNSESAFDTWMSESTVYGIVSLDADADGEYDFVALVAPVDGPDFIMDTATGEMEPAKDTMNDASQEDILAAIDAEALLEEAKTDAEAGRFAASVEKKVIARDAKKAQKAKAASKKPRKARKSKTKSTPNTGAKVRNFEILASHIESNPGVSRTDVFADAGLQSSLRTKAQAVSYTHLRAHETQ